ncbi:hypothetical protein BK664_27965 [Pseudomonas brassicacearum]|uniref:Uncharacterized protein n=1 Tax=Pseudomonas brassicacearum TaxID=930166 RepID=A0A423J3F2_9PSED|nr:hypothetical protein BK664_27965 [Pseudomonas brassicacearum]
MKSGRLLSRPFFIYAALNSLCGLITNFFWRTRIELPITTWRVIQADHLNANDVGNVDTVPQPRYGQPTGPVLYQGALAAL